MKALKVVLVLVMVSFTMMSYAQFREQNPYSQASTTVHLKMLLDKPIYVNALLTQVNPAVIFNNDAGDFITVKIVVHKKTYFVTAPYADWKYFFNTHHILPFFKKSPDGMFENN